MGFFDRLSNGWNITMSSFKVLRANKQLIVFPVLSGAALVLIMASFGLAILAAFGFDVEFLESEFFGAESSGSMVLNYGLIFCFYVVNYFVITFFNMALIHCARLYFHGEEVTVSAGLRFSLSRIGVIFSWALFAATVGTILRAIQENTGIVGKIITGLIGIVWSIATFFVVPVIAYENCGPIDAFRRSAQLMREKWGESLGSRIGFGVVNLLAFILLAVVVVALGATVHWALGVAIAVMGAFSIMIVMSAAETIFIAAVYHNVTGTPVEHFNQQLIDGLFEPKN
ncbi:DUF6159 family protein [Flaviaesturariibacter amylovorans]|uniref:DUF6159 family protein n=1 Tax=Flaviaesturariibacter amylovorans TaxID=1084520 RepID=A0ABP8GG89_9BACT